MKFSIAVALLCVGLGVLSQSTQGTPEQVLRKAVQNSQGVAEVSARAALGRFYERAWRLQAAAAELQLAAVAAAPHAATHQSEAIAVQLDLARVLLKRGDVRGAARLAEAHADLDVFGAPAADVARTRGDIAKAAGQYAEARAHYRLARDEARARGDLDALARTDAAMCDVLQLERKLAPARVLCERALAHQAPGHADRAETLKTLGLIYYFGGDAAGALRLHLESAAAFAAAGDDFQARWMRELAVDDEALALEGGAASALAPLVTRLQALLQELHSGDETVWWRVSEAQLRLSDLQRQQRRWADAERSVQLAVAAFEQRPEGWRAVPDYATVFEFAGVLAADQGKVVEARRQIAQAVRVMEAVVGAGAADSGYLREMQQRLGELDAEVETAYMTALPYEDDAPTAACDECRVSGPWRRVAGVAF